MNLWDKISSLIAKENGAGEQHAQAAAQSEAGQARAEGPAALSPAEANTVLSMLPKGQGLEQFSAGQIQLLNIESVRTDLGDRWFKVEHHVHLLIEATLRRLLSDSDIFTQISDYEYLVIFPNLTEQKASALMYVAAAQIRQKLFGHDPAFAAIRLNATVTRVGGDLLDKPPDAVTSIHEATLLGQPAQPAADQSEQPPPPPAPIAPWTDKYKAVPIEGGHMTHGRLVADVVRTGRSGLDFSDAADARIGQGATSDQALEGSAPSADPPPAEPGYPVVSLAGGGKSERRMVEEAPWPQKRLPDFSSVHATSRARPGMPGVASQESAESETPPEIAGYPVVPIAGSGSKDSFLVPGAPRAPGRVSDFSPANTAAPAAPHKTGAMPGGVIVSPALTARLDSLTSKTTPLKAVPITRPSEAPVGQPMVGGAGAHEQAAPMAPVEIEELRLLYEPIWDVKRQAVTAYRMNVTLKVEGTLIGLNDFTATYDDPTLRSSLDAIIMRKLVSQIQQMRGEHKKAIIVAPIGRRTIEDESGLRFVLDQLSLLSEQERRLVVLEISNAYFGAWPALTPRIAMIHRVCRNVAIRLSLDHKDFQQVAATGANTVTGDLTDHDWPERQTMGALNAFAAGAAVSSLRSAVAGLGTSSTVIAAVCAGLGHLSGKAVGEGTPAPLGVYSLSTEGFYLQRQAQRLQQDQGK